MTATKTPDHRSPLILGDTPLPQATVKRLGRDVLILGPATEDAARAHIPASVTGWDTATAGTWMYKVRRGWIRVAPGTPGAQTGVMFRGIPRPQSKVRGH